MSAATALADFVSAALAERADPAKAAPMAAYMKTDMPFYGVQKKGRVQVLRAAVAAHPIASASAYRRAVLALWRRPHREEKYLAIAVARAWPDFVTVEALPLYERLIREGAWWDLVDEVATQLVGRLWDADPATLAPVMDEWIDDADLWIRRTAVIAQVKRGEATDHRRLFRYCRARAAETDFFIRKAIGWALRAYSYAAPERVARFLERHRDELSGLSYREGAKVLRKRGQLA